MLKNLFVGATLLAIGFIAGNISVQETIDDGEIIVDDDEKYIRVAENKSNGWSYARVNWKQPQK